MSEIKDTGIPEKATLLKKIDNSMIQSPKKQILKFFNAGADTDICI